MKKQILSFLLLAGLCAGGYAIAKITISSPISATTFDQLMKQITDVASAIVGGLAVVMFIVAGILFLAAAGEPERLAKARHAFIWGVIGVAVAIGAQMFVAIINGILQVKNRP